MIKIFRYLYYLLYSWNLKTWGKKDGPQWNALFGVSFMMFLNLSVAGLMLHLFGVHIYLREEIPRIEIIIIMISLFVINYFLFIYKGKYKLFVKEFKKESQQKRRINVILTWLYVFLSLALLVLSAVIVKKLK